MDTEIRVSTGSWPWRRKFSRRFCRDSNPRPFDHESGALTTELLTVSQWKSWAKWEFGEEVKHQSEVCQLGVCVWGAHSVQCTMLHCHCCYIYMCTPLPIPSVWESTHSVCTRLYSYCCCITPPPHFFFVILFSYTSVTEERERERTFSAYFYTILYYTVIVAIYSSPYSFWARGPRVLCTQYCSHCCHIPFVRRDYTVIFAVNSAPIASVWEDPHSVCTMLCCNCCYIYSSSIPSVWEGPHSVYSDNDGVVLETQRAVSK